DIFSCKAFDPDAALRELEGRFGITSAKTQVLDRGLEEFADAPVPASTREVATASAAISGR
ncbi:MAG: hypothetical protein O3B84_06015, partial [Chloroflexi bacterium]|nr:hypothetical protein [Chloroflexota bacterium]